MHKTQAASISIRRRYRLTNPRCQVDTPTNGHAGPTDGDANPTYTDGHTNLSDTHVHTSPADSDANFLSDHLESRRCPV